MILEVKHMRTITDNEISKLQNYLELIRLAGGWSRASFSELLGITKQTLINLEKKTSKLSKLQYIGIRTILDYEVAENPDNKLLPYALEVLLNKDSPSEEEIQELKKAVAYVTGAKSAGLDTAAITTGIAALLSASALALDIINHSSEIYKTSQWLIKLMKTVNTKK